jgi:hypothetical protein
MKLIANILCIIIFSFKVFSQTVDEKSMIYSINKLRSNPEYFIEIVEKIKIEKTSNNFKGFSANIKSNVDWVKECDETIEFLKKSKPIDTLSLDKKIYDILSNYNFIGEHTNIVKNGSENLVYINNKNIDYYVAILLIDPLYQKKQHRLNLMDPNAKSIAVKRFDNVYVQSFIY